MSLPPPVPGTGFVVGAMPSAFSPRRPVIPRRRRIGWSLIVLSVVVLLAVLGTAGLRVYRLFTSIQRTATPGTVSVACQSGDVWRIGPLVGTSTDFGPLTVGQGVDGRLGRVEVLLGGTAVPVEAMGGGGSEQFNVDGASYLAVATFECPRDGEATVRFLDDTGSPAAVFPAFRRLIFPAVITVLGGLASTACGIVGIVLAVRHRRSLAAT